MKKILKTSFFVFSFLALFYSNAFAFLEFQKSKILSTDVPGVRGINFKPDGSIMYITNRVANQDAYIVQYSLSTPFDISTATRTFDDGAGTKLTCSTDMQLPHAIEFKPDGDRKSVV